MLGAIIGGIGQLASTWLTTRAEGAKQRADLKIEAQKVRLEAQKSKATEMAGSWKDELWTVAFIALIFANFVPALQPYLDDGFARLNQIPEWLQYGIMASIAASFGLTGLGKFLTFKDRNGG